MQYIVQKLQKSQLDSLTKLHKETTTDLKTLSEKLITKSVPTNTDNYSEQFLGFIDSEDCLVVGTFLDQELVGYLVAEISRYPDEWLESPYITLTYLGVTKNHRKNGIATQMLNKVYKWATDINISFLELRTLANNINAQNLYKSEGFENLEVRLFKKL